MRQAWKGYDFSILDTLKEEGIIQFSSTAKSPYLTKEGVKKAEEAIEKVKMILKA